ncbi:IS1 family transposase [Klebsiella pneumoniae]|uniref:IS1 family transposase n=1 Tax=Klebsiella pneumoniae TaxID=573 RepID=UPI00388FF533
MGFVGAKSRQRWLFYAYDRIRRTVVAQSSVNALWPRWSVFRACCRPFEVVVWMTDDWPAL